MKKKISLGLLVLTATLLITGASTVDAFPTQTIGCDNCHAYPPKLINITTDKAAITVSPGYAFNVNITWSGGASNGVTQTAVKWPTALDNALFGLDPAASIALGVNPDGTATSALTAPATPGIYTVRVYAATGTWAGIPTKETDYKNITVTVQAPPTPVLTTMTVSPATASLIVGETETFTASALDQFSNPIAATITWNSSNTTVGTIDVTGKFTALAAGTANITASNGTVNGSAIISVTASPISSRGANITFVVTDNVTGLPVEEAAVSMDGFKIETDDTGTAIFTGVAPGDHAYAASGEDYMKNTGSVSVSGDTTVVVKLVPCEEQEHEEQELHREQEHKEQEHKEQQHKEQKQHGEQEHEEDD